MKKFKRILITVLVLLSSTITTYAYDIEENGIQYDVISLNDLTLAVVGGNWRGDVVIPSNVTYNGRTFTVTKIAKGALNVLFDGLIYVTSLSLPATLKEIEDEAILFYTRSTPAKIYIPADNQIEVMGYEAICDMATWDESASVVGDIHLPCLKKYYECAIGTKGVSVTIPKGTEFVKKHWFNFGQIAKLTLEEGEKEQVNQELNRSYVAEIYLGRALFFNKCDELIEKVKKLTIAKTPDDIYNLNYISLDDIDTLICYAKTPPSSMLEPSSKSYMNAKVFVPDACVNKYKNDILWKKFWNILPVSQLGGTTQCEKPTISFSNGKLKIESSTAGSTCIYSITDDDIVSNVAVKGDINLTGTYNITAYATADGYEKSETVTATLCYIDGAFSTDGIETTQATKRAVLVSSNNGKLIVSGLEDGEEAVLYTVSGSKIASSRSSSSQVLFDASTVQSNVCIIKIGNESIKVAIK